MVKPLAIAVLSARTAYRAGLIAAPDRISGPWLGPAASTAPVHVPARGLSARAAILHGAALAGALSDVAATSIARHQLPSGVAGKTLAIAGSSALASAALAAALDARRPTAPMAYPSPSIRWGDRSRTLS